jgi:hypothetical protein
MKLLVGLRNWKLETRNWSRSVGAPGFHFPFSSFFARWGSRRALFGVATMTYGSASVAYGQGCAMCYASASAAKAGAIQALRSGILVLLIPTLLIFAVLAVLVYRRRNQFNEAADWTEEQNRKWRNLLVEMESAGDAEAHQSEVESPSPVS